MRNVLEGLPKQQYGQVLSLLRAAWKVKTAEEGEKRMEQLARFLERDYESAVRRCCHLIVINFHAETRRTAIPVQKAKTEDQRFRLG